MLSKWIHLPSFILTLQRAVFFHNIIYKILKSQVYSECLHQCIFKNINITRTAGLVPSLKKKKSFWMFLAYLSFLPQAKWQVSYTMELQKVLTILNSRCSETIIQRVCLNPLLPSDSLEAIYDLLSLCISYIMTTLIQKMH